MYDEHTIVKLLRKSKAERENHKEKEVATKTIMRTRVCEQFTTQLFYETRQRTVHSTSFFFHFLES